MRPRPLECFPQHVMQCVLLWGKLLHCLLPGSNNKREETAKSCTGAKQGREPGACCMNGEEKQLHHEKKKAAAASTSRFGLTHSLSLSDSIPPSLTHCLSLQLPPFLLSSPSSSSIHPSLLCHFALLFSPFICCHASSLSLLHLPHPSICFSYLSLLLIPPSPQHTGSYGAPAHRD